VPEASKTQETASVTPPATEFNDVPTLGSAAAPLPEAEHAPAKPFEFAPEKPAEPAPVLAKAAASEPAVAESPASQPAPELAKPAELAKTDVPLSAKPAAPVAEVAKAPEPVAAKSPEPAAAPAATKPGVPGLTPSPVAGKRVGTPVPGTTTDPRERAERRARVIVSDLSLYHKDLMNKAAQATDAKKELGTLWRDAVLAYDRTVPLEVRSNTHYLEDALDKYLAQLRQAKAAPAGQAHG
jgi:hypothetical protein